ncbi:MAG: amino acid adenylation domain-containing protein, partial [Ignavibacteriales bacterium]
MENIKNRISGLSPEKLALLNRRLNKNSSSLENGKIQKNDTAEEYPMSSAQKGIWFLQNLKPDSSFYNIPAAIRLKGILDLKAFKNALQAIVSRHQILRANFQMRNGEPFQIIRPLDDQFLLITEMDKEGPGTPDEIIKQIVLEEGNRQFNLAEDKLFRARLIIIDNTDYLLLLTFHHIISDGWSIGIFTEELSVLYQAYQNNTDPQLKKVSIQYSDYALWQKQYLASEKFNKALTYWKTKLAGIPLELSLPLDKKRPVLQTYTGAHYLFPISGDVVQKVKSFCFHEGVSEFMFFLTAFELLMHRYSGQEEFGIGVPVANRSNIQTQDIFGLFTNTIVIRTDLTKNPSIKDVLTRTNDTVLEAFEYQECPFDKVVNSVAPDHNASSSPVFQVMFDYQSRPMHSLILPGVDVEILNYERGTAKFDMFLSMEDRGDHYECSLEYCTDLFEIATVRRMAGHFKHLVELVPENHDFPVSAIQILSESEIDMMVRVWNSTASEYQHNETFQHLFELQVKTTPDKIAVSYDGNSITYEELNRKANKLAHFLRSKGVGPDTLVGIYMERSLDLITGIIGVLKSGGAYLPLDVNSPVQRISMIIEYTRTPMVLTQNRLLENLSSVNTMIVSIDQSESKLSKSEEINPEINIDSQNLAYVIFTSGSTGRPKGVMIHHFSMMNLLEDLYNSIYSAIPIPDLTASMNAPVIFDISVQHLLMLLKGLTINIIPEEIRRDGDALLKYLRQYKVDVLDIVPSQLRILLGSGLLNQQDWMPHSIMVAGEPIDEVMWKTLANSEIIKFYDTYGPTEATVIVTRFLINGKDNVPLIGKPISNTSFYILDMNCRTQPVGVPGELYISGECLSRGYFNRPELTAEKFIPDPFSRIPGTRMYKTGDLARYTKNGDVEYLGRSDNQVKIRGYRIELGEIESAINELPDVKEVAVIIREDVPNDKKIVAYLIPKNGSIHSPSEIKNFLRGKLPEYMIPVVIVIMDSFPLTASGKIDRKALPAPVQNSIESAIDFVPPSTFLERELVRIWESVLEVEKISVNDSFFELGGDSIKAAITINRMQSIFNTNIPVKVIFLYPYISKLARHLSENYGEIFHNRKCASAEENKINMIPRDKRLLLSSAQKRLWFLDKLEPDSPFYNISAAVKLTGYLDPIALENSFNELIHRHEILRTYFIDESGNPSQVIVPSANIRLNIADITGTDGDEIKNNLNKKILEEVRTPFDLSKAPLLRCVLLRVDETQHILLLTMHHIISDGWSMNIVIREMSELYKKYALGVESDLAPLPIQYADYAAWHNNWIQSDEIRSSREYWIEKLKGCNEFLELPILKQRPAVQSFHGLKKNFTVDRQLYYELKKISRKENSTLFVVLLTGYLALLHSYTRQEEINIGTPVANRNNSAIENLIGFFVNILVLRNNLAGNPTYEELLHRVKEVVIEAFNHQEIPFEVLVDELKVDRSLDHSPLFQTVFVFQNTPKEHLALPGLEIESAEIDTQTAKYDLTVSMTESEPVINASIEYNTDLFSPEFIDSFIHHFINVLNDITSNLNKKIESAAVLGEVEKENILFTWNKTDCNLEYDITIHQLFELQAEKHPESEAVIIKNRSLTYRELNEQANQLANFLKKNGIGYESRVGISMKRSAEMIITILGILKAGGVYVPLDPAYPRERLNYMLSDSNVEILIIDENTDDKSLSFSGKIISYPASLDLIFRENKTNLDLESFPENLAYVIYTSGSTGEPKGAMLGHRGVVSLAQGQRNFLNFSQGRRVLQFASLNFDASVWEIFMTLLNGATLCLCQQEDILSGDALVKCLIDQRINITLLPPSFLSVIPDQLLPDLDVLITGGEPATWSLIEKWSKGRKYYNAYGPTEATVCSAFHQCRIEENIKRLTPPIGKAISNYKLYVLDKRMQPVPVGVSGELHIGGIGLARGYLNRPELTAEKFVPNPFAVIKGERLYKTGDLVRYL